MSNQIDYSAFDDIARAHGVTSKQLYVVLSADGSTLMRDPGLDRAYAVSIKKVAEETASLARAQGFKCYATDLETALASILRHPKNLPPKGASDVNGG